MFETELRRTLRRLEALTIQLGHIGTSLLEIEEAVARLEAKPHRTSRESVRLNNLLASQAAHAKRLKRISRRFVELTQSSI